MFVESPDLSPVQTAFDFSRCYSISTYGGPFLSFHDPPVRRSVSFRSFRQSHQHLFALFLLLFLLLFVGAIVYFHSTAPPLNPPNK